MTGFLWDLVTAPVRWAAELVAHLIARSAPCWVPTAAGYLLWAYGPQGKFEGVGLLLGLFGLTVGLWLTVRPRRSHR